MQVVHYEIPVRGAATVHLTVDLTVHGPITARTPPQHRLATVRGFPLT